MKEKMRAVLVFMFVYGVTATNVTSGYDDSSHDTTNRPDGTASSLQPVQAETTDCSEDGPRTNCTQDNTLLNDNEPACTELSLLEDEESNVTEVADPICEPAQPAAVPIWNQGRLSQAQYNTGDMVCRYLFIPLVISAVLLNTFNIIVYTDVSMRSPTSTYLIALSTNELVSAIMSIVRTSLKVVYGTNAVRAQGYLIFVMYINNPFKASIRRLMYCFSVLVSTERFLAVAFPLKARNFRLVKSPIVFIVVVTCVTLLCHSPGAFKFNVVQKPNSTDYTISPTSFYINTGNFLILLSLANKIIYTYSLLIVGLIVNFCVLLALRMHSKNRKQMNTSIDEAKASKRERQTTVAILTSSFLFTFLALPLATDSVVSSFLPHYNLYNKEHYVNLLMKDVNDILILFSLSTDFVFYISMSKAYRKTFFKRIPFVAILCRRKKQVQTLQSETKISSMSMSITNNA